MNKQELIKKIKVIDGLNNEEKTALIDLLSSQKKYGLVWEDKPEEVENELREKLPILIEVKDKAIFADEIIQENTEVNNAELFDEEKEKPKAPNHILIEGDNLHALSVLNYTHAGKVDVIYIDPPYNTGNKDFKYNDKFVDKEDSYRHSKWLSFISKRLKLAKNLLKDTGVIFISIDDNEVSQLKLLCNELFGEENFVATLPTVMNLKGNQDEYGFAGTHEYSLVYVKNKSLAKFNQFEIDEEENVWDEDEYGYFKKGAILRATGEEDGRANRPYMFYPILVKNGLISTITEKEYLKIYDKNTKIFNDEYISILRNKYEEDGYYFILPTDTQGTFGRWRWGYNVKNINKFGYDVIATETKNGITLYKKQRPGLSDIQTKKPKSIFYKPVYSSGNGTAQLKEIIGFKGINNPKPMQLLCDFFILGSNKKSIILDFFAGSGTTLHATMQLNAEDGGNRQCILVTNNENNIAEEVCYERNKRVINGYTKPNGDKVSGLRNNNLRYYKTDFVDSVKTINNRKKLMLLAKDMLCIKEDCYKEFNSFDKVLTKNMLQLFENESHYMLIIYDEEQIDNAIEIIKACDKKVKVYIFSPGQYPFTDDFDEVIEKVELCALPDAIYKAYKAILPKKKSGALIEVDATRTSDLEVNSEKN